MKKLSPILLFFFIYTINAQNINTTQLGQVTLDELKMTVYEKDKSAPAVILYEEGNQYFSNYKKKISAREFYIRTKILNNKGLDKSSFIITLPKLLEIKDLKGITYNLEDGDIIKSILDPTDIIIDNKDIYFTKYIVNLPNIKVGSVYELTYKYYSNGISINHWFFQEDIPKIRSKFTRLTPKTMDYIVNLIGPLTLTKQNKVEKTKCFKKGSLKCALSSYEMDNVPAFKKEIYMPSSSVLISKLKFKISYFFEIGYRKKKIFTKWSQFDSVLKPYYFDKEMTKKRYFKKIIPDSILANGSKLKIAKNIFHFIQDHYSWNNKETGDTRINLRNNFKNRVASVDLIATTLYNALQGAGIECYYVAVSTRNKGPIDRDLPNVSDFNYTVIKAIIDNKTYFLDATDKSIGFGFVQPFASVKEGRVLDYTIADYDWNQGIGIPKGSYWEEMKPLESSSRNVTTELYYSNIRGLYGTMRINRAGYNALNFRRKVKKSSSERLMINFIENQDKFNVLDYTIENLNKRDLNLIENIKLEQINDDEKDSLKDVIRFNPILINPLSINPFKTDERTHPIDFTYPRNLKYRFTFHIPKGYRVINLPKNISLKLPGNEITYIYKIQNKNGQVKIYKNLKVNNTYFNPENYAALKEMYSKIIDQEKIFIELTKIKK